MIELDCVTISIVVGTKRCNNIVSYNSHTCEYYFVECSLLLLFDSRVSVRIMVRIRFRSGWLVVSGYAHVFICTTFDFHCCTVVQVHV